MRYMLLIYGAEDAIGDSERDHCYEESTQLTHDLNADGKYITAAPLHSVSTATSVRIREGKTLVTDGPFAETKEQLGGFYMVEANDLDDAIRIAERVPPARWGTVEIRPVVELPNLPQE